MSATSFTLIIPTRNRPAELLRCLSSLVPQFPADGRMDVIICNDGDDVQSVAAQAGLPIRILAGPRRGPGPNRNLGASHAGGDWLIFLDDDCLPQPRLLDAYFEFIDTLEATTDIVLAGPTLRLDAHRNSLLWEAPENTSDTALPPSCNFAMPRGLFERTGGFDERYRTSFEDMEFFARLRAMGVPIRLVEKALIEHDSRPIPSPKVLANRWEARVISSLDFGASPAQTLWRLPRHVAMVILSRFRGRSLDWENIQAAFHFAAEFLFVIVLLPAWIARHSRDSRSPFWIRQRADGFAIPRFGL